ncbi:MAG: penicillin-binding protein 2 [Chloroflexota bacterium]
MADIALHEPRLAERRLARFVIFAAVAGVVFAILGVRLFYLQIIRGGDYGTIAGRNSRAEVAIPSSRGLMYDRTGRLLVQNVPTFSVKIRPADLPLELRDEVIGRLAALLGKDPADIVATLDASPGSRFEYVRVASDVPEPTARLIAESHLELPGVQVVVEARREYLYGPLFSQILGYTGAIDATEYARLRTSGYLPDDAIGKTGVEAVYESALRGQYGVQIVERDARGRQLQVLQTLRDPVAGASLELTIDTHEQQLAEKALRWGMQNAGLKRGVVIVMNPQTGEILAMVSLPTYDDNLFARGISRADFQRLLTDPHKPLLNHGIQEQFPPGSTYKLVTAVGGLADRKITPQQRLQTKGYLTIGTTRFYDWNRRGFGLCDLYCGFSHSSDTYFYQVAGMLGIDRLADWAHEFGFGQPTGVDLPGEAAGIVPSNQWKLDTFGQPIYPGEVYQAGIGQGYDAVTPLQLLNAYAALANGGTLYRPQVVRQIIGPDGSVIRGFLPEVLNKIDVSPDILRTMRRAARAVVTSRHTYNLVDLPIVVAGKTGTAEYGLRDAHGHLPFHSWFVAFVPKDPWKKAGDPDGMKAVSRTDSDLAVVAFAYDAQNLGNVATEIVKYYLQLHYGISKDYRLFKLLERTD